MTQLQTLNVEYRELMARADELEAPIPEPPTGNPKAPCSLLMVKASAEQLGLSAKNMAVYLGAGRQERQILAASLRNAAKAYEELDWGAAAAITNGASVSARPARLAVNEPDVPPLTDTRIADGSDEVPYYPVKQAAQEISETDEAGFETFESDWTAYQLTLQEAAFRFRPFEYWVGEAVDEVEAAFEQHRSWLYLMAGLCTTMATQARGVVSTQRWALRAHPTVEEVAKIDNAWIVSQRDYPAQWPNWKPAFEAEYAKLQQESEDVLAEYRSRAALPLTPINPKSPPVALVIEPTLHVKPEPRPRATPGPDDGPGDDFPGEEFPGDELPLDENLPNPTGLLPGVPPIGTPPVPPMPEDPTGALAGAPGLPAGSGLKPASFGGAGIGGGVPAIPSLPLQPPFVPDSAPRPVAAEPGATGLGRGIPAGYAALGGGGGMAPMVPPAAAGQDAGKGKRRQQGDKALYTEERPWTEGVIGRLTKSSSGKDVKATPIIGSQPA